ncbi:RsmB/NOP family class I SAM-dependent RNA methyltransferase [Cognatishimia maritima]|uniref:16S rRNA (Cytosine967-C5)-methyltransferase n=1 Tax=Cognatishimia maritima TaxID=870908 RepID=A0A1M5IQ01_9RHOB|nr:RsmB/NOP family class I SAM-dependent RNA methyltransferase [Cognatishimia maritima]SHG30434.1 16S rRNA (cytosine967-C5)-methyltransferase [Cognatishimia maritima]
MTPAARVQTAIELLEPILDGAPAERVLTSWARRSRFAGSKDRAAIRDLVFDALRLRNSAAQAGSGGTARAIMLGMIRLNGEDVQALFDGSPYGPAPLSDGELPDTEVKACIDLPDWVATELAKDLGDSFAEVEALLKQRAPVILRVNLRKATLPQAKAALAKEGIETKAHPASGTALEVTEGARKIRNSVVYKDGLVELQDAASQAAIDLLPLPEGARVLDYCAGGGGKLLAMAGRFPGTYFAHDAIQSRLRDLPERARRAGVDVTVLQSDVVQSAGPFDLVFCDVPCSGSGTWRRDPDAKWKLTPEALEETCALQAEILSKATDYVTDQGHLVYATCSLLARENEQQIDRFMQDHPNWDLCYQHHWTPLDGCDGFFTACLRRSN